MVIHRPVGVRDAVTELSALVNAARSFGGRMAADASREAELLEETLHPGKIFTLLRIDFGVCAFEVSIGQYGRGAMSGARDEDRIQLILVDEPVEVNVGEALARVRAPVAQESGL